MTSPSRSPAEPLLLRAPAVGGPPRGSSRRASGSVRARGLKRCVAVVILVGLVGGFAPTAAQANPYNGMLQSGTVQGAASGSVYAANSPVTGQSWTAPSGVQFGGFAYTSASFNVANEDDTGGLSSGFTGSGGSAPTDLNFPWTRDCSVSESAPRVWIANGAPVARDSTGPGGVAPGACNTTGNTSGWNYVNAEAESTDPASNPQSDYQTLKLWIWCARDGDCSSGDAANYSVTNLSGNFQDSYSQPSASASWGASVNGSAWYQTQTGALGVNYSAHDPAGVCSLAVQLQGAASVSSGSLGNANPAITDPGPPVGEEFANGLDPCWAGQTETGTWTLPANLPSGSYAASVLASNPGNYEAQGFSPNGSPVVASTGAVHIDDTAPVLSWATSPSGWTAQTSESLNVTTGPSGLASLTCSDNGDAVTPLLQSGSTSGAGTTVWAVPTPTTGVNAVSCTAANGDANGALSGSTSGTFDVDDTVPTISYVDQGYTPGSWTDHAQNVAVDASAGPSGIRLINCSLDRVAVPLGAANTVVIAGNSPGVETPHVLSCYAISNTGVSGASAPATFDVAIDTNTPTVAYSGAPANGTWIAGTPTVVVSAGELNTATGQPQILSGIAGIACTDNGSPVSLPALSASYVTSFELTQNGPNQISCVATTGAGTVGKPFVETVNVQDPAAACSGTGCGTTQWGSSPLIDGGGDPYSNGPSESTWSRTAQPITITANLPAGQAPVASIACTGALTGSWPLNNLNRDAAGGEQITVTVPPPGGELTCSATDAAGNVYQLGSYQFEEDATPPAGQFDNISASAPDDIELSVYDPGGALASGIAYVRVYATNTVTGSVYDLGLARLAAGGTDVYEVNLDDADVPAGSYEFSAQVGDVAGNTAEITAGPQGTKTVWQLPLRATTELTLMAGGVHGAGVPAVPTPLQPYLPNTSSALVGTSPVLAPVGHTGAKPRGLQRRALRGMVRTAHVAPLTPVPLAPAHDLLAWSPQALSASAGKLGRRRCSPNDAAGRERNRGGRARPCSRDAVAPHAVAVAYGRSLTLTGALRNIRAGGRPIPHAPIDVWGQVAGHSPVLLGTTTTSATGAYRLSIGAGASRSVYVTYAGTRRLRAAVARITERFAGGVTLNATQAAAGQRLTLSGRVLGGHVPARGLNVTVEGKIVGYPGSQQLGTVRTDLRGSYRFSFVLPADTRGLTYRLWLVVLPRLNPGWPFLGAHSRTLTRHVG